MAIPLLVDLSCPLCGSSFQTQDMGDSYYISGIDTDLRETGSVEQVRRFSVASCPGCGYSDFTWDFTGPVEIEDSDRVRLIDQLKDAEPARREDVPVELKPFLATERCFRLRGMDLGSRAELALLTYYVSRDLGSDLQDRFRVEAAKLFSGALLEEEGASLLSLRYAYLAGELRRLGRADEETLGFFDRAVADGAELEEAGVEIEGELDLLGLAHRRRAELIHGRDSSEALVALCQVGVKDVRAEVTRILATRRDPVSLMLIPSVFEELAAGELGVMLRAFVDDPHPSFRPLLALALESNSAESVRLAARGLGALGQADDYAKLMEALRRGLLTTESALVEAVRAIGHPEALRDIAALLAEWQRDSSTERWAHKRDLTPLKNFVYQSGGALSFELLKAEMEAMVDNDLWDKPPFGSPIAAAISLGRAVTPLLRDLMCSDNPVARRWSAHIACELQLKELAEPLGELCADPDSIVRLQARKTLARLGCLADDSPVLELFESLDSAELPFALHFLVEFRSVAVREYLLGLLEDGAVTAGEVLPLLGRQQPDPRIEDLVRQNLVSEHEDHRAGAVTALSFRGRRQDLTVLEDLLSKESSEIVRRRIIYGLARIAEHADVARVTGLLRSQLATCEPRLRLPVAMSLLHLGDDAGIALVRDRAAAMDASLDHYDVVAPAIKVLRRFEAEHQS
jgi:hypothetical protein